MLQMSSITLPSLSRLSPSTLRPLISSPKIAIIDVRDSDHVGGHINQSIWAPSSSLSYKMPELVRTLKDKEMVVFHCALSQQRGPSAALSYARERVRLGWAVGKTSQSQGESEKEGEGEEEEEEGESAKEKAQEVAVLDGGFVKWQEAYGEDPDLTKDYVKDIWQDY